MSHHLRFSALSPQEVSEHGFRIRASKSNFPALQGMSLYKLVLQKQAVREPHWHANADELGYCLEGEVLVSMYGNRNTRENFIVKKGEVFFVPSGALHSIENVGEGRAELLLQFSAEETEDFGLSSVFNMFSNSVLGNTWSKPAQDFASIRRPIPETFIGKVEKRTEIEKQTHYPSIYHFGLEASAPLISNPGGEARVARGNVWPILQRQALYSLVLNGIGMREPHWHPETAELGYVEKGKGRMSILSPSGEIDAYEMNAGDIYFIPKAYPHHIENLTNSPLHILIFFDQSMPQDIGFTGSVKSFSDGVLTASIPGIPPLPIYYEDLFIVDKM